MKAQIQMFESVAILVVFFFLTIFGAAVWYGTQKTSLSTDLDQTLKTTALNIALTTTNTPETDCSLLGVQQQNCIDIIKAKEFAKITAQEQSRIIYFELFGFSKITLQELYPSQDIIELYNNPLSNYTDIYTVHLPILISNPAEHTTSFGIIEVQTYAKR